MAKGTLKAVDDATIEYRLQAAYQSNDHHGNSQDSSLLFPDGHYPHNIDYKTFTRVPQYLIEAELTPGVDGWFDRFSYWGWTAAAIEPLEMFLDEELELPPEIFPEDWEENENFSQRDLTAGVVLSRLSPLQTALRLMILFGRMEKLVRKSNYDRLPTKTALLGDLPRTIEYLVFALFDGIASTAIDNEYYGSWESRVLDFTELLSDDTQSLFENVNNLSSPNDYLPEFGTIIADEYPELIQRDDFNFSTFFGFLTSVRNRTYHDARDANFGSYVLTLICAVIWDQVSEAQYQVIQNRVLELLNEDLNRLGPEYDPDSGFEDFCLCSGGKRYLEFYPFSSAELSTEEFDQRFD